MRIEDFVDKAPESIDVVTARAVAPLPRLLSLAYPLLKKGALGLFPKGQDVASELTEAAKYWKIQSDLAGSRTDERAQILVVRALGLQRSGGSANRPAGHAARQARRGIGGHERRSGF